MRLHVYDIGGQSRVSRFLLEKDIHDALWNFEEYRYIKAMKHTVSYPLGKDQIGMIGG